MTNYQKRKEKNDEYRSKIMRFTSQLSLGDGEVRDWFEQQPEKGAYLKDLILRDKAEWLGYREQKSAEPDKAGDYEIIQSIRMGGRVLLMGFNPKDETYMTCYQQYNFLGETIYPEAVASKDYRYAGNRCIRQFAAHGQCAGGTAHQGTGLPGAAFQSANAIGNRKGRGTKAVSPRGRAEH